MATRKTTVTDPEETVAELDALEPEVILGEDSNGNVELHTEGGIVLSTVGGTIPVISETISTIEDIVPTDESTLKMKLPENFIFIAGDSGEEKVSFPEEITPNLTVGHITVEIKLSKEEEIEIKQLAYEGFYAKDKIDYDRMVGSVAQTLMFLSNDDIVSRLQSIKDNPEVFLFPDIIDVYLNELIRREVDTTELRTYFESIEYRKPWLRM